MAPGELPTSDMLGQLPDLLRAVVPFGPDGADELSQATFPILLARLNFCDRHEQYAVGRQRQLRSPPTRPSGEVTTSLGHGGGATATSIYGRGQISEKDRRTTR